MSHTVDDAIGVVYQAHLDQGYVPVQWMQPSRGCIEEVRDGLFVCREGDDDEAVWAVSFRSPTHATVTYKDGTKVEVEVRKKEFWEDEEDEDADEVEQS